VLLLPRTTRQGCQPRSSNHCTPACIGRAASTGGCLQTDNNPCYVDDPGLQHELIWVAQTVVTYVKVCLSASYTARRDGMLSCTFDTKTTGYRWVRPKECGRRRPLMQTSRGAPSTHTDP
jgi:hypothetical protein